QVELSSSLSFRTQVASTIIANNTMQVGQSNRNSGAMLIKAIFPCYNQEHGIVREIRAGSSVG
ncbi:MAG TPA: hypothetical protein VMW64_05060, partial [Dehalococcoidia bacterium]|nr:hypothetical protein [Dehalococcoidia bacterium]